jgi:hypothetical protein
MAIDFTQKRINWINTGMALLFGQQASVPPTVPVPPQQRAGFYVQVIMLEAWMQEGVVAGFLPNGNTPATSPIAETDFPSYPNINAAAFMAAIGALQTLNADYQAVVATLVALKP